MERKAFGKLADGEEATLYTISNTKGMYAQITDFGASIVSLVVKDKDGKNTDVVLGYENAETYQQQMASFGAVVGSMELPISLRKTIMKIICTVVHRRLQDVCGMLRNRRQTKLHL